MESGSAKWDWVTPWGLTSEAAHGGAKSWTDSPGTLYANDANTALETRISLTSAVKPVLRFWEKYQLEANADYGYVDVSGDGGSSWRTV
jgi:hypothetical protein